MSSYNYNNTVGKLLLVCFLTVFFSEAAYSKDNSLMGLEDGLSELVYDLSQSIVSIEVSQSALPDNKIKNNSEPVYRFVATGMVFDSLGHILTSAKAVGDYKQVLIRFENRNLIAKVVAVDYQNGLALLRTDQPYGKPIKISKQSGCAGQMVLGLGSSAGLRVAPSLGFCAGFRGDGYLQFLAMLPTGSTGGGLFNLRGQLVGIISDNIVSSSPADMGLALPINKIIESYDYLMTKGSRQAGYLGLSTAEIEISPPIEFNSVQNASYGTNPNAGIKNGIVITRVVPKSPAARAGLRIGDVIYHYNRKPIKSALCLAEYIKQSPPGHKIEFDFLRNNQAYKVLVTLTTFKPNQTSADLRFYHEQKDSLTPSDSMKLEVQILRDRLNELEQQLLKIQ